MKELLEEKIREAVDEIKEIYQNIAGKESNLPSEVGSHIWEHGKVRDIVAVAHYCGRIDAFRSISIYEKITLSTEVTDLFQWIYILNPA